MGSCHSNAVVDLRHLHSIWIGTLPVVLRWIPFLQSLWINPNGQGIASFSYPDLCNLQHWWRKAFMNSERKGLRGSLLAQRRFKLTGMAKWLVSARFFTSRACMWPFGNCSRKHGRTFSMLEPLQLRWAGTRRAWQMYCGSFWHFRNAIEVLGNKSANHALTFFWHCDEQWWLGFRSGLTS